MTKNLSGPPKPMWPFEGSPEIDAVADRLQKRNGHIPHLYRPMGHAAHLIPTWLDFATMMHNQLTVDMGICELAVMRKAYLYGADYLWRHHWLLALKSGVTEEKLRAVPDGSASSAFTPAEAAVIDMADELHERAELAPELWKALRIHFADKEVVELIVSTAWYGCAAETTGCLKIELDDTLVDVPAVPSRW